MSQNEFVSKIKKLGIDVTDEKINQLEKYYKNSFEEEIVRYSIGIEIIKIYELILKFANYGFNKSHSVGYATVAYKMAFLKTYFFKYFETCAIF